ncbi:M20/M25/M40 family metallo-hydrolase [Streptomyces sp. NPDC096153]|uniref:M20/M25/M40 family metallo-hydrolase n=1 Tax=Streptomyces sp. NPDC096153 TaxID=3155548 RepID=UPI00331A2588
MNEAAEICSQLIQIDTTNHGDNLGPGERRAAEYVAELLNAAGVEATLLEISPRRTNVVARVQGNNQSVPPLLIHGHLDTVPADAAGWTKNPLSGEIHEGFVWGRGAIDMKGSCASIIALVRAWARKGQKPARDIVLAFTADEESTGEYGAYFLAQRHREFFDGCREAISESGGFSMKCKGKTVYPVAIGERGIAWLRLKADGVAGHGSRPSPRNAVAEICHALSRISAHRWPLDMTGIAHTVLLELQKAFGSTIDLERLEEEAVRLGPAVNLLSSAARNSANTTMLKAGDKVNVIPSSAEAHVDGRFLPGQKMQFFATLRELLGEHVDYDVVNLEESASADLASPTFAAMCDALRSEDPDGHPVPYVMSGGTDAKAFANIGIQSFGFSPLQLPSSLNYWALFHGVDERIPVDGLAFGVRVLDKFLRESRDEM